MDQSVIVRSTILPPPPSDPSDTASLWVPSIDDSVSDVEIEPRDITTIPAPAPLPRCAPVGARTGGGAPLFNPCRHAMGCHGCTEIALPGTARCELHTKGYLDLPSLVRQKNASKVESEVNS